jgi:anti-anti-sigma factor
MSTTTKLEIGSRLGTPRRLFRLPAPGGQPKAQTNSPVSSTVLAGPQTKPVSRLAVAVLEAADEVIVLLGGEAAAADARTLETSLRPLSACCPSSVTFDLSELRFISSLAMGVLVSYRRAALHHGVRVCLSSDMQPQVRDSLETAGMMELFEVVGEPNSAPSSRVLIGGAGI